VVLPTKVVRIMQKNGKSLERIPILRCRKKNKLLRLKILKTYDTNH
jgi:hypothetical protein